LLIHMLANAATNMFVTRTVLGLVPALLRTKVAILFAMSYFESAAATVKPPSRSMMTGVHIAAKMYFAAASASNRRWGLLSDRTTRRITDRKGIKRDVANKGIT
jgi:hypothetical protein